MSDAPFEKQMEDLEQLVARLEKGELPLEQSLEAFQKGMELVKVCRKQLEGVELKVQKIVDESGATEPLMVEA